jgi:hypothetical protein
MSDVLFVFGEWYKDIRCQVCKMLSRTVLGGRSYENPQNIKLVGFEDGQKTAIFVVTAMKTSSHILVGLISGARQCRELMMSATTNKLFPCRK